MGRNLLSCLFFVPLFLQGGLCRVLCVWGRKQGGAFVAGSLNGSPLGEPCRGCPMEHSDGSKYLYSMVPVHPQGSRGLRAVELLADIPPNRPEPPGPPGAVHPRRKPARAQGSMKCFGQLKGHTPGGRHVKAPWHRKRQE